MSKVVGEQSAKYRIQVYTVTTASKFAGVICCNSKEEYEELFDKNYFEFMENGHISTNVSNDFDVGDVVLEEINFDDVCKYYLRDEDNG